MIDKSERAEFKAIMSGLEKYKSNSCLEDQPFFINFL